MGVNAAGVDFLEPLLDTVAWAVHVMDAQPDLGRRLRSPELVLQEVSPQVPLRLWRMGSFFEGLI